MDLPLVTGSYAFILKLTDEPGGMEVIAATFAHRGVSLSCSLGNDGALDPQGRATVIVTFCAAPAKKEIIRRALGRLSRVRSLTEHPMNSAHLCKTALLRVAGEIPAEHRSPARLERVARDEATGESTYLVADRPDAVDAFLERVRGSKQLLAVTSTVLGL